MSYLHTSTTRSSWGPATMPDSDYGDLDDEDLVAVTSLESNAVAAPEFDESPRPPKRRKLEDRKAPTTTVGGGNSVQTALIVTRTITVQDSEDEDAFDPAPFPTGLNATKHGISPHKTPTAKLGQPTFRRNDSNSSKPRNGPIQGNSNISPQRQSTLPWSHKPSSTSNDSNLSPIRSIENRTGVGLSPSKKPRAQIRARAADDSDSDDAFDPPARPVREVIKPAFDANTELADIPSDAFDSSSSPQKSQSPEAVRTNRLVAPQAPLRQTTLFGRATEAAPQSQVNKRHNFVAPAKEEPLTHHELDLDALTSWVYPTNIGSVRDYQFNIVQRGLFHNLLVALPTGLGKTFIAATIMLNWYRWTKTAQIVFVAPTKPLVSQQVQACFGIAGIPRSDTTMLTGGTTPGLRAEEWSSKRVFFMTPQTMINDLKTGICDPKKLVLIVVDEAHKATGAYAYAEIVRFVRRFNPSFRVLALTATPGSDVESVQEVIDSLDVSRVEIRTEQSLDIRQYVHSRQIDKHVFENTEEMEMCMDLYSKAVRPVLAKLNGQNAYWVKDPVALSSYGLTKAMGQWFSSEAGRRAPGGVKGMVRNSFTTLASLAHSMDLLKYHGMGPFYQGLLHFQSPGEEHGAKLRKEISQNEHFVKMMVRLKAWVNNDEFIGHPKLEFLQQRVMTHFLDAGDGRGEEGAPPSSTRIMIFAHWRDSAEEIVKILKRHEPMIRPHVFVGQAASRNSEGMDQKRQLEIIHKFKTGVYNTLVATSIGEEGLDIGEIDLIVCYDSKASPIRMLQRMGRTGRKRAGRIILLQMKGKEEDDAAKAKDNYEKMQEMIASGARFTFHDDRNRRIIPREFQPLVNKRVVEIPIENSQLELPEPKRRAGRQPKRPPKKFNMPDGVITGFTTVSRMNGDGSDLETAPKKTARKRAVLPSNDTVAIPALEEFILNDAEQAHLARYLNVPDNSELVSVPSVTKHPSRQRQPFKTKAFRQLGRSAKGFVKTVNAMHNINEDKLDQWQDLLAASSAIITENLPHGFIVPDPSDDELDSDHATTSVPRAKHSASKNPPHPPSSPPSPQPVPARKRPPLKSKRPNPARISNLIAYSPLATAGEHPSSSPPATDPRMRILSQAISLGSDDTSGDEGEEPEPSSELAAFVADDSESIAVVSSSLPVLGGLAGLFESEEEGGSEGEELPDVREIGRRRVEDEVEDEEEEEEDDLPVVPRKRKMRVVESDESDE